jgi:DNA recombination protein RmuC
MNEALLWLILLGSAVTALLAIALLNRVARGFQGAGKEVRDELRTGREEARSAAKELREEVSAGLRSNGDTLSKTLESMANLQQTQLEGMTKQLKELTDSNRVGLDGIRTTLDSRVKELQESNEKKIDAMRKEASDGLKSTNDALSKTLESMGRVQEAQLEGMTKQLKELTDSNRVGLDGIRTTFDSRVKELQESNEKKIDAMREEASDGLKSANDTLSKTLESVGKAQQTQLEGMTKQLKELTDSNRDALDGIRSTFDSRVKELQEANERKLDEMRKTVDEKLHDTLEKRLGESFKLVSDRLDAVHKGLGEMQHLATGVGDLKRVLANVKTRGTWAEVQLGAILEQVLTPEQYAKNVQVKEDSAERVDYAVRLPGSKEDPAACVWLPIDSKFPQEDYRRLQEAADKGDPDAVQTAADDLARTVRAGARDIQGKYVNPPSTTDFAIMFLATEGLYAEVLRQSALVEDLQQRCRVVVAGPTTLAAILSSLRMGFQTLVIEKRAAEVWAVLGAVKTEFGKFGHVLDKVKRQLSTASQTIEETGRRSRAMERKLRLVGQLPEAEASAILALPVVANEVEAEGSELEVEAEGSELEVEAADATQE